MARPIVLFVAGMGRSGSTLLGDVLDTFDGVTAVGELHHIWGRGAVENWRCGDGPLFREHPVWQRVVAAVEASDPGLSVSARAARVQRLRRNRRKLVRHPDGPSARAYRAEFEVIYKTLAQASGAGVLVDTGKVPFHAAIMQTSRDIDFRVLHLVRDPCAVAFARSRTKPTLGPAGQVAQMQRFSAVITSLRWLRRRQEVASLARGGLFTTLSYEAFCDAPSHAMRTLRDTLSLPFDVADIERLGRGEFTRTPGIAFSGNPNRLASTLTRISTDDRWRAHMPWYNKVLVRAVSGAIA